MNDDISDDKRESPPDRPSPAETSADDSDKGKESGYKPYSDKEDLSRLRPFQFKKGVSGNPKGRPKGAVSLKQYARDYIMKLSPKKKREFMAQLPPELIWRMAEGNPHQSSSEEVIVLRPVPLDSVVPTVEVLPAPQDTIKGIESREIQGASSLVVGEPVPPVGPF